MVKRLCKEFTINKHNPKDSKVHKKNMRKQYKKNVLFYLLFNRELTVLETSTFCILLISSLNHISTSFGLS